MKQLFTEHPNSIGETYGEHAMAALSFAGPLFMASLVCLVHAILPFAFEKTGSRMITRLHDRMVRNRNRHLQGNSAPSHTVTAPAE